MCAGYGERDAVDVFDRLVGESVVKAERRGYVYRAPVDGDVVEAYGRGSFEEAVRSSVRAALREQYRGEVGAFLDRGGAGGGAVPGAGQGSDAYVDRMWGRVRDNLVLDGFTVVYVPDGVEPVDGPQRERY